MKKHHRSWMSLVKLNVFIVVVLATSPTVLQAAEESLLRGAVLAKLDRTALTLGSLCLSGDGTIYVENETGGNGAVLRLDRHGKTLWQTPVFESVRATNSAFGPCNEEGAVYARQGRAGDGPFKVWVVRVSGSGAVIWTREFEMTGCTSTQLFDISWDRSGAIYVGGKAEGCSTGWRNQGYIARFGADGTPSGAIRVEGLEKVRRLDSDGRHLFAVGEVAGRTAVVSLETSGTRRWMLKSGDMNLPAGAIEGVVAGPTGVHICVAGYGANREVELLRLDDQGVAVGKWSYEKRSTPVFGKCLLADPGHQGFVLVMGRDDQTTEVVRMAAGEAPAPGVLIENTMWYPRGAGISDDGSTFYLGGLDTNRGSGRTQIIRYQLPASAADTRP
jgi:outer membrane protein assembly factor BamB